jgi:predicted transport protein
MKAIDRPFANIINGTTQFVIPVFQRDYTWTEQQCAQLWSDVLHAADGNDSRGHFLGSIVYVATGDSSAGFTRWLLIDGQQRLTTLTLLLTALRDHIRKTGWSGDEDGPTAKRINAYFLKNVQEEGAREQKLVLRRHDHATLTAIIDGVELPDARSERVKENYESFRERLTGVDPADVYRGVGRLVVVDVALDRQTDDAQLIFESLNSTGVDLSQSDLIRNYILMRLPEKEQTHLYNTYWSNIEALFRGSEPTFDAFARDYVALMTQASKQEKASEVYYAFRRFFPELQKRLGELDQVLADILRYARYYAAFSLGRGVDGLLAEQLGRVRRLVDVPATLIMQLYDRFDRSKTLTESQFVEALSLMESYVLRRAICGFQTRGYWQVFANLAYRIGQREPLIDLKVEFARLRESYRFPQNDEFQRHLTEADLYGLRVCRHLLERLENYDTKEPSDTKSYSIEHIMPQNERIPSPWRKMLGENWKQVHSTWLHRLGNLTLTGYNSKYSDQPFDKKKSIKGGFSESSIRLNKFVREQAVWTESEIETRGKVLARTSLKVWPPLVIDRALVDAATILEKRELAARRDVSKVKMSVEARAIFEKLDARVLQIDGEVFQLAETHSVSYHGPSFFLEVLPRKKGLTLLLALDFSEIDDPLGIAQDATQWKFFVNAKYEGGVSLAVSDEPTIAAAMPIIRQAHAASIAEQP